MLTSLFSTAFLGPLQECDSLESLHRCSKGLLNRIGDQTVVRPGLESAILSRMAVLVRRGFASPEAGAEGLVHIRGMKEAGLVSPPGNAVVLACLATALTSISVASSSSASRMRLGRIGSAPAGLGSHRGQRPSGYADEQLLQWAQLAELFAEAVAHELLTREGATEVELHLQAELRKLLAGSQPDSLRRGLRRLRVGTTWVSRGAATAAAAFARSQGLAAEQLKGETGVQSNEEALQKAMEAAAKAASEAAVDALAAIAKEALQTREAAAQAQAVRAAFSDVGKPDFLAVRGTGAVPSILQLPTTTSMNSAAVLAFQRLPSPMAVAAAASASALPAVRAMSALVAAQPQPKVRPPLEIDARAVKVDVQRRLMKPVRPRGR